MTRPLVKICGITSISDARTCVDLGVDLIGLNFYEPSPRFLKVEAARRIADAVRGRVELVGVMVDRSAAEVEAIDAQVGLDRVQFHGDEPEAMVNRMGDRAIRALRVDPAVTFEPSRLEVWPAVWGFLFDVACEGYGGSGVSWPYDRIAASTGGRRTMVAGGISPETAREALKLSGAGGVDVCSGVETAPGVKDADAIERLVEEVRGG